MSRHQAAAEPDGVPYSATSGAARVALEYGIPMDAAIAVGRIVSERVMRAERERAEAWAYQVQYDTLRQAADLIEQSSKGRRSQRDFAARWIRDLADMNYQAQPQQQNEQEEVAA